MKLLIMQFPPISRHIIPSFISLLYGINLNNNLKVNSYLTENTVRFHYKDKSIVAHYSENCTKQVNIGLHVREKAELLNIETGCTFCSQVFLEGIKPVIILFRPPFRP
jgi:hypothetical protein